MGVAIGFEDVQTTFIVILAACAAFASLYGVFKTIKEIKKPAEVRDKRIEDLELEVRNLKAEQEETKRANALILKAQLCLIDAHRHGDDEARLDELKVEIEEYLIFSRV